MGDWGGGCVKGGGGGVRESSKIFVGYVRENVGVVGGLCVWGSGDMVDGVGGDVRWDDLWERVGGGVVYDFFGGAIIGDCVE